MRVASSSSGLLVLWAQCSNIFVHLWRRFILKVGRNIILGWAWKLWVGGPILGLVGRVNGVFWIVGWERGSRWVSTWLGNCGGLVGLILWLGERMNGACWIGECERARCPFHMQLLTCRRAIGRGGGVARKLICNKDGDDCDNVGDDGDNVGDRFQWEITMFPNVGMNLETKTIEEEIIFFPDMELKEIFDIELPPKDFENAL
ncbi:hypothetical protein ACSQ67_025593 [Phaseolus vulgaris]